LLAFWGTGLGLLDDEDEAAALNETSVALIGRRESARGAKKIPYQSLKS
jgi:hypothetical protein